MQFRKLTIAAVAASLIVTPTVAAASGASAAPAAVVPASEQVGRDGQQLYGASVLLQVGLVVVAAALIYLLVDQLKGSDKPSSP